MKKTLSILGMCTLILLGTACSSDDDGIGNNTRKDIQLTRTEQEMVGANNDFAFDFYNQLNTHVGQHNMMVSPLSLTQAMAMLANGADGNTKTELMKVLGFEGYSLVEMNAYYMNLNKGLLSADKTTKLSLANSFWLNNQYIAIDSYKKTLQANYDAEVKELAFDNNTYTKINQWAEKNTYGCIKKVVSESDINSNTIMALLNATYFNGAWKDKFEEKNSFKGNFEAPNKSSFIEYMKQDKFEANVYEDAECKLIELPYGNEAFSMVVVLPNTEATLDELMQNVDADKWQNWMEQLSLHTNVLVQLPKFTGEYEYNENLKQTLVEMGVVNAFSALDADFSQMIEKRMFVNFIKQNSFIKVNEEGTEAAAVTVYAGENAASGGMKKFEFKATRPFFYAIKEKSTGVILFMGKVTNPKE
ncbi:MAG: serpin family protein [Mediterranea massiliensis]|nr:serpin family protein [Mediterranea massiliensis]